MKTKEIATPIQVFELHSVLLIQICTLKTAIEIYRVAVSNPPKVAMADVNEHLNTKQLISTSELKCSLQFVIGTGISTGIGNIAFDSLIKAKQS